MLRIFDTVRQGAAVRRRHFITAGATGLGGLLLSDLLRLEAASPRNHLSRSVILIHLDGGPPHLDLIDPKPEAPREIRGEFTSIPTRIPGFRVSELLPKIASIADRLVFIRSLVGSAGAHNAFQCQSGFTEKDLAGIGGRPAFGCVLTRLLGRPEDPAPAFVDLMQGRPLVRNSARPGFLGPAYAPFRPDISRLFARPLEDGMKKELARLGEEHATRLELSGDLTVERLEDRMALLGALDRLRRDADATGSMSAMDRFARQALGILTSGRFAEAMDFTREEPRVLARYSLPEPRGGRRSGTTENTRSLKKFLLARRLVEAGVRCVSISLSDFDTHSDNFPRMRYLVPLFDHGLYALVTDLEERGLLDRVLIVAWGEFGRTPRIDTKNGGRHHWPKVGMAVLAGGGLRAGQVLGATDRTASEAVSRPLTHQDVFATLYHQLGIDPAATTLVDPNGRPQHLLVRAEPIGELV